MKCSKQKQDMIHFHLHLFFVSVSSNISNPLESKSHRTFIDMSRMIFVVKMLARNIRPLKVETSCWGGICIDRIEKGA